MEFGASHQRQVRALLSKTGFRRHADRSGHRCRHFQNYTIGGWSSANVINDTYVLFYPRLNLGGTLTVVNIGTGTSQNYAISRWSFSRLIINRYVVFYPPSSLGGNVTVVDLDIGTSSNYSTGAWSSALIVGKRLVFIPLYSVIGGIGAPKNPQPVPLPPGNGNSPGGGVPTPIGPPQGSPGTPLPEPIEPPGNPGLTPPPQPNWPFLSPPPYLNKPRDPFHPTVTVPRSADPNDILGPDGLGAERWISGTNPINYTIRFENDPLLANAPAQVIRITQTLDSDLDPRSFRLGSFGFGEFFFTVPENRAFYSARLDLLDKFGIYVDVIARVDIATSSLIWEFTSIDPLTGEVPVDRFIGFLPPNVTRPEGDGFVSYSIRPRRTAANGSVIDAEARIFFDDNAPIDTPPIFNTLDNTTPTSIVTAMPALQVDPRFRVSWSGGDGDIGSGLKSYDVYVSENGGGYSRWLTATTLTDAEYLGEPGKTYAFYSIANDNVENSETPPSIPDAVTSVF